LINDLNQISNKRVWRAVYPRGQSGSTGDVQILEQLLEHEDGRKRLVWYWYDVAGWQTTNAYEAKGLQLLGLLTGQSQASVIAIAVDTGGDIANAREVLGDFVSTMAPSLAKLDENHEH
jgi:EpsI family protein